MDFLTRYFTRIKAQLVGLTVSQKMVIGLLALVMVATIFAVVRMNGTSEMVELLPGQASTPEEIAAIKSYLTGHYQFQVSGTSIMVPQDQAYLIRGELAASHALPDNTMAAFQKLAQENESFMTQEASDRRWVVAKQDVLSRILSNFPYIRSASVIIAKGERSGLGRDSVPSSASVTVWLKTPSERLSGTQVLSIVDLIRGAVAGLKREDVHITDGTRAYQAPSDGAQIPTTLLEFKQAMEDTLQRKLYDVFSHLEGVKIAVNVVPDLTTKKVSQETYDPKGVAKAVIDETSSETLNSDPVPAGAPGVNSNVSASIGGGAVRTSSSTKDSTTKTDSRFSKTDTETLVPAGTEIKRLTASLTVPRSYFVAIYKRDNADAKTEPDDTQLQPVITANLERIRKIAMNTIGAETPDQVQVDWFDDLAVGPLAGGPAGGGAGGSGGAAHYMALIGGNLKQVALFGLACFAFLTMAMMVRRAAPATAGAEADPNVFIDGLGGKRKRHGEPDAFDVDEDVIGEAGQSDAVLTGIELDDDTLQSRKMVDEVSTMIKENPENAASLVKRWLAKGK